MRYINSLSAGSTFGEILEYFRYAWLMKHQSFDQMEQWALTLSVWVVPL